MAKSDEKRRFFGEESDLQETVVAINRSSKVVKGGRRFSFSALTVVGDRSGRVGVGYGKANEVPPAVEKSIGEAKRNLIRMALKGDTIPHAVTGRFGASRVFMRPAGPGTGVIAGGGVRAVCQMVGIRNILTKSLGSNNPINLVKAAMDGLMRLKEAREVARLRGVPLDELIGPEFARPKAVTEAPVAEAPAPEAPAADTASPETPAPESAQSEEQAT
ncbi:MAG: 30S ribosomal protein S5 [Planctomycetes bacterium]|nr:30S ribosomal protein S5 [Planctomycetota bacterium]